MKNPSDTLNRDTFSTADLSVIAEKESWRKEVNRPLYHIHKWWATRLGTIFRAMGIYALSGKGFEDVSKLYDEYDFSDKIILDPFMGSGTTLGELSKLGAKCIGSDINPVSNFLVHQEFQRVPLDVLDAAYRRIEFNVASRIKSYYTTINPATGEKIPVLYFLWVKVVKTPNGEAIPLFQRFVFAQNAYPKKKPEAQIICPSCHTIIAGRYDSQNEICPKCSHSFNPQKGWCDTTKVHDSNGQTYRIKDLINKNGFEEKMYAIVAIDESNNKVYLPITKYDRQLYENAKNELKSLEQTLKLPDMAIDPGINTDQAIEYGYKHWRDFFNYRQQLCLGLLLDEIMKESNIAIRGQLLCLFSSTLEFNNMFCSYKGEGTGAVRPVFSNHILKPEKMPLENSIWGYGQSSGCFSTLYKSRLLKAKEYLDEPFELTVDSEKVVCSKPIRVEICSDWESFCDSSSGLLLFNKDSSNLPIPSNSVDAVITDPPYFDFINYSELSDFFYAWLCKVISDEYPGFDRRNSRHEGEVQNPDPKDFSKAISRVFKECHRVLKDEGLLEFTFHHSTPYGWAAISSALSDAGFYVDWVVPVHGELRMATIKSGTKEPISLDMLILCRKKTQDQLITQKMISDQAEEYIQKLVSVGMRLSATDHFVIKSALCLMHTTTNSYDFDKSATFIEQNAL